jgi:hypothetical protein
MIRPTPRCRIPVSCTALVLFAQLTLPATARGATVAGVGFDEQHRLPGAELTLNCAAVLKYMKFVNVYAAALYLGSGVPPSQALTDVPKRLEIEYFYDIDAEDFARVTATSIAANVDERTLDSLRSSIDRINALYEDVSPGDRYTLTYVPGEGTELSLNGVPKGTLPGSEFASALFSIWLGSSPIDASLKRDLLYCSESASEKVEEDA